MRIKKYVTSDMQEALNLIRQEMGPEAVIISSQNIPRKTLKDLFRRPQLEVTAAVEDVNELEVSAAALPEREMTVNIPYSVSTLAMQGPKGLPDVDRFDDRRERVIPGYIKPARLPEPLVSIETEPWHFESVLSRVLQMEENSMSEDIISRWKQIMHERELHLRIVEGLFDGLDKSFETGQTEPDEMLTVALRSRITRLVQPAYCDEGSTRILTFIGPTGVGKTTTLLKLATRKKVFEQKSIALIALFNHRFGALEKLRYYGDIIGVPVEVVMTPVELREAVESHRDKDFILIDTEGRPSKNTSQVLELKCFLDIVGQPQDVYLVLSCTTKARDLERIAVDFQRVKYNKIIFTKLDETDTYGAMLNIICKVGAPVSFISRGQSIPDDIEDMHCKSFAALII